jgi:DNA-directed RNA polymerase beta' subunit
MNPQNNAPMYGAVQDGLLGGFEATKGWHILTESSWTNCLMRAYSRKSIEDFLVRKTEIVKTLEEEKLPAEYIHSTRTLYSMIFPSTLVYTATNRALPTEPTVKISRGVLLSGALDKSLLGTSPNSLIQIIFKDFGRKSAVDFLSQIQWLSNSFLEMWGYSIGLSDCIVSGREEEVENVVIKSYMKAKAIEGNVDDPRVRELQITNALNNARDGGQKLVSEIMNDNAFLGPIMSKSKGSMVNILQITCMLGQQTVGGKRAELLISRGRRTLVHYFFDEGKNAVEFSSLSRYYESRGFIRSSFFEGLSPRENYFHSAAGREGVVHTARSTAESGYGQRRLMTRLEDMRVGYDGTVRNSAGSIIQYVYGGDSMDGGMLIRTGAGRLVIDLEHLADIVNETEEKRQRAQMPKVLTKKSTKKLTFSIKRLLTDSEKKEIVEFALVAPTVMAKRIGEDWEKRMRAQYNKGLAKVMLYPNGIDSYKTMLRSHVEKSQVAPCEPVGPVAAQCISQPMTQQTLNVFHSVGQSNKNVTLGMPRFKEVLNTSRSQKIVTTSIFFKTKTECARALLDPRERVWITVKQMMADREFTTECEEIDATLAIWRDDTKVVIVYYPFEEKINKEILVRYISHVSTYSSTEGILIYNDEITAHVGNLLLENMIPLQTFKAHQLFTNITLHVDVPKHTLVDIDEYNEVISKYGAKGLKKICNYDPVVRYHNWKVGSLIRIEGENMPLDYRLIIVGTRIIPSHKKTIETE